MRTAKDFRPFANEIVNVIRGMVAATVRDEIDRVMKSGAQPRQARSSKIVASKTIRQKKKAWPTCPVSRCRMPFAPRFGGYCKKHRDQYVKGGK